MANILIFFVLSKFFVFLHKIKKMIITILSDTHGKHRQIEKENLPGGDLLIHGGDITELGYTHEVEDFCEWFDGQKYYDNKIFIAGNHDFCFEDIPTKINEIVKQYTNIVYLQDENINIDGINIWGTPWQPRFFNWAFNLDRNGEELKAKWDMIPKKTDILITHGPSFGILDVQKRGTHMGCELMTERIKIVKPKIHIFGHNHYAYGHAFHDDTLHINATVLNERYVYTKPPITIDWNPITGEFIFI